MSHPPSYPNQPTSHDSGAQQNAQQPVTQQPGGQEYAYQQSPTAMYPSQSQQNYAYGTTFSHQSDGNYPGDSSYVTGAYPAGYAQTQQTLAAEEKVGFFKALFDLKFEHFVTIKFAAVVYVIEIVLAVLTWIGITILAFMFGFMLDEMYSSFIFSGPGSGFGVTFGLITLFLGWIPAVVSIFVTRIAIEFVVASIRTAQSTTYLAKKTG